MSVTANQQHGWTSLRGPRQGSDVTDDARDVFRDQRPPGPSEMLDVTANNLANVDTIGLQGAAHDVRQLALRVLAGGIRVRRSTNGGTNPEQIGLGVQVGSIDNIMSAGSLQNTGNTLDVAIQGDGFLCTSSIDPVVDTAAATNLPVQYTRAGNLTTTPETLSDGTSVGVLTTSQGRFVLGSATPGDQTSTPPVFTDIEIPAGSDQRLDRPGRIGQLHRRPMADIGNRGVHRPRFVPERIRTPARGRVDMVGIAQLRPGDSSALRTPAASRTPRSSRASSSSPTST